MSDNSIGLQTARGSGTSGHVQKNVAAESKQHNKHYKGHVRKRNLEQQERERRTQKEVKRKAIEESRQEIIQHEQKRRREIECMHYRETLEDEGLDEDIIEQKVDAYRRKLLDSEHNTLNVGEDADSLEDTKANSTQSSFTSDIPYGYKRRYNDSTAALRMRR